MNIFNKLITNKVVLYTAITVVGTGTLVAGYKVLNPSKPQGVKIDVASTVTAIPSPSTTPNPTATPTTIPKPTTASFQASPFVKASIESSCAIKKLSAQNLPLEQFSPKERELYISIFAKYGLDFSRVMSYAAGLTAEDRRIMDEGEKNCR